MRSLVKNSQYYKFCLYGFLKNLRFFDAFFILFLVEKGLTFTQIGILYAVREVVTNIFELPSGLFADTFGRKYALSGSFVLYIFSFVVFFFATDFWFFIVAFIFYGMADAFRSGTHKSMIMDYLKENKWESHKIKYYGHTRSCSQKGSAISALLAGVIVFYYGNYNIIFAFSIVPYLINLILILSYPKSLNKLPRGRVSEYQKEFTTQTSTFSDPEGRGVKPFLPLKGFRPANKTAQISENDKRFLIKKVVKDFMSIIQKPKVLRIVNSSAIHSAYQRALKDYIQILMLNVVVLIPFFITDNVQKKNGLLIGLFYFGIYLMTSQASKFASFFDERIKRKTSYITLLYGFGFGVLSGVFYSNQIWVLALLSFIGIYLIENIRKPVLTGVLSDNVPNEILASIISAQSLWKTIITSLIALFFGIIADYLGVGLSILIVSSILLLATILFDSAKA